MDEQPSGPGRPDDHAPAAGDERSDPAGGVEGGPPSRPGRAGAPRGDDPVRDPGALRAALEAYLRTELAPETTVDALERMTGGASRETWAFDAASDGGSRPLVLRRDRPGGVLGTSRGTERAVLAAAAKAGVPVPGVVCGSDDPAVLGAPFFVMARLGGEALPRRILRDDAYAHARDLLVGQCGAALARIHDVDPGAVTELGPAREPSALVAEMRSGLDALGEAHPVFEVALNWLDDHTPEPVTPRLVHGDFRVGNLLVDTDGLVAVLDWELAHTGDPTEDLGWMCVRSWRFGNDDAPAAGLGTRSELLAAYAEAGGRPVDEEQLRFWEVYGNVRWGLITIVQAAVHLGGAVRSVELAAIGRRTCEVENDLLDLLGAPRSAPPPEVVMAGAPVESGQDRPSLAEALDAVAGWLDDEAAPNLAGRPAYHRRVASRLLRIAEREARLGPGFAAADRRAFEGLLGRPTDLPAEGGGRFGQAGSATVPAPSVVSWGHAPWPEPLADLTAAVAGAIRARGIPADVALPVLREVVDRKLAIANPTWPRP